jgi:hypothetical protein
MGNPELNEAICRLISEIAKKEKIAAVSAGEYGSAFVAAIVESIFAQAAAKISLNHY